MPPTEPSVAGGSVAEQASADRAADEKSPGPLRDRHLPVRTDTVPSGAPAVPDRLPSPARIPARTSAQAPVPIASPTRPPHARQGSGAPRPAGPSRTGARAFPRSARLLNGPAYDAVFADNRRLADRYWTVLVREDPDGGDARLGLAVAKKRARRAVDRNRIKRVARESFRHARVRLGPRHVVVMNRDAASGAAAAELRRSIDALWTRLLRQSAKGGARGGEGRSGGGRDEGSGGGRRR